MHSKDSIIFFLGDVKVVAFWKENSSNCPEINISHLKHICVPLEGRSWSGVRRCPKDEFLAMFLLCKLSMTKSALSVCSSVDLGLFYQAHLSFMETFT